MLVALVLIVLFTSISIIGALNRIRDANEKTLSLLEEHFARQAQDRDIG